MRSKVQDVDKVTALVLFPFWFLGTVTVNFIIFGIPILLYLITDGEDIAFIHQDLRTMLMDDISLNEFEH